MEVGTNLCIGHLKVFLTEGEVVHGAADKVEEGGVDVVVEGGITDKMDGRDL